jgi:hypothetical protein
MLMLTSISTTTAAAADDRHRQRPAIRNDERRASDTMPIATTKAEVRSVHHVRRARNGDVERRRRPTTVLCRLVRLVARIVRRSERMLCPTVLLAAMLSVAEDVQCRMSVFDHPTHARNGQQYPFKKNTHTNKSKPYNSFQMIDNRIDNGVV